MSKFVTVVTAEDVIEELMESVFTVVDGWYQDSRVDWEDVIDRVERRGLEDGRALNFGDSLDSPAIRRIKYLVRKSRATWSAKTGARNGLCHSCAPL